MTRYIYMEASPALKGKARQFSRSYRKMAVVELEDGFDGIPKMISERARGVKRVVACSTEYVGKTDRSAGLRTHERFIAMRDNLNAAIEAR